ncbi:hypothetical protein AALH12_03160 [Streptococcus ferus]|uniref:hypothetical protein n=1 Tax=Streptococcus ferus TaxID=1345 RepID=UPI0035116ED8
MRKTILNASLEESTNLVTDKYIQVSIEDINKKGVKFKIFGFLTLLFFMYLLCLLGNMIDELKVTFLFIKPSYITNFLLILGFIPTALYFNSILKIRNNRILAYYYYNIYVYLLLFCFGLQTTLLFIAGSSVVLGPIFSTLIYGVLLACILLERYNWFKQTTLKTLYGQEKIVNTQSDFMEKFVSFSKKYGGIIIVLIFIIRLLLPGQVKDNDFLRTLGMAFSPLMFLIGIYFTLSLATESIQGYYLKKYLEDYRQLSGYSLEEWYGPKSKKYRESLKK